MGEQRTGFHALVLASRCRWTTFARPAPFTHRWLFPLSANDNDTGDKKGFRRVHLVTKLFRLPIPRLQYQHRLLTNRRSCPRPLGKDPHDAAVNYFTDSVGLISGESGEYSLILFTFNYQLSTALHFICRQKLWL